MRSMYALVGRVELKRGREDEAAAMLREHGVVMVRSMAGSSAGYWARTMDEPVVQHSFWLFETEEDARGAEVTFNQLRSMPDAPAMFVSVDVCEVVGQT
jgi:hypothetical protein